MPLRKRRPRPRRRPPRATPSNRFEMHSIRKGRLVGGLFRWRRAQAGIMCLVRICRQPAGSAWFSHQHPVQRFLPATPFPLQRPGLTMVPAGFRDGPLRLDIRLRSMATGRKSMRRSIPPDDADAFARSSPLVCRTGASGAPQSDRIGPISSRFPRVAGGRPLSAGSVHRILRLYPAPCADPASLQRLAVYPRWDGTIVGTGWQGEENAGRRGIIGGFAALCGLTVEPGTMERR
jgi:hypothetical protein